MNLFLTVGTQWPFDRLTRALDQWCASESVMDLQVFGQIGPVDRLNYAPRHFEWTRFLTPEAFGERFEAASHIVSHAGMGTIITAMVAGKPVTILPRRAHLGEQRNDHQLATIRHFADKPGVHTAETERDVPRAIMQMLDAAPMPKNVHIKSLADTSLTDAIRAEIMA